MVLVAVAAGWVPALLQPFLIWADNGVPGHDATVVGDRLYDFHGNGVSIYDNRVRAMPQLLGTVAHPSIRYYRSGWPTFDGRFLFMTDEVARGTTADVTIWDIAQVDDPVLVSSINDPQSTVHNVVIVGDLAFMSYYTAGFRVYDVTDPAQPALAFEYDTSPSIGEGWLGAFGVYPFAPSGNVYVSDIQTGLHIFSVSRGFRRHRCRSGGMIEAGGRWLVAVDCPPPAVSHIAAPASRPTPASFRVAAGPPVTARLHPDPGRRSETHPGWSDRDPVGGSLGPRRRRRCLLR